MTLLTYASLHHPLLVAWLMRLPSLAEILDLDNLTADQCEGIIWHELAHMGRRNEPKEV